MKKLFDPKIFPIISFLISISVGLVTWKLGANPGISLLVAVVIELIILMHYFISRLSILESLLGYSQGVVEIGPFIPRIHRIVKSNNRWRNILLRLNFRDFSLKIDYLENNKVQLSPSEFMDFAEILYHSLSKSDEIEATSLFGGGAYWSKRYGMRYAELNKDASDKGAKITRVFIPRNEENSKILKDTYAEQSSYISVFVADYQNIYEMDSFAIMDFFILNDELVIEYVFNADFSDIKHIDVITSLEEIKHYRRKMNVIKSESKLYDNKETEE